MNLHEALWAQVFVEAIGAFATLVAVVVALWLPRLERGRAARASARAVWELSKFGLGLHARLEQQLLSVDPRAELRELQLLMSIAERVVLRDATPASLVAVFMLQQPEMRRVEAALADWVGKMEAGISYEALPLRHDLERLSSRLTTLHEVKRFANL